MEEPTAHLQPENNFPSTGEDHNNENTQAASTSPTLSNPAGGPSKPQEPKTGWPWKSIIAAVVALIVGFAFASAFPLNPKQSRDYRRLENNYSKLERKLDKKKNELDSTKDKLDDTKDELDDTKDDLKDARKQLEKLGVTVEPSTNSSNRHHHNHHDSDTDSDDDTDSDSDSDTDQNSTDPDRSKGDVAYRGDYCDKAGAQKPSNHSYRGPLTCKTPREGGHLRWLY